MNRAAVKRREPPRERQAQAQPSLRAIERPGPLRERIEYVDRSSAGTPGHRLHSNFRLGAVGTRGERHVAAAGRVLGGVGQQVGDHLHESIVVAIERQSRRGHVHAERVPVPLHERARHVHGTVDHEAHLGPGAPERHLAARQAGEVEQVVDQPGHVADLALEDLALAREDVRIAHLHQFQRGQRRRQRIAELVAERGEEVVLGLVGVLGVTARLLRPLDLLVPLALTFLEQQRRRSQRVLQPLDLGDVRGATSIGGPRPPPRRCWRRPPGAIRNGTSRGT